MTISLNLSTEIQKVVDLSNVNSIYHFIDLQQIAFLYTSITNDSGGSIINLLNNIELLQPLSHLLEPIGKLSQSIGEFIGIADVLILAIKAIAIKNRIDSASAALLQAKQKELSNPYLTADEKKELDRVEEKIFAETQSLPTEALRLAAEGAGQLISAAGMILSIFHSTTSLGLLPLKAFAQIFTAAAAGVNYMKSENDVFLCDQVIHESLLSQPFSNHKMTSLYREAIEKRHALENLFLKFRATETALIFWYAVISASIGVFLAVMVLAGGPAASFGAIIVALSVGGALLSLTLFSIHTVCSIYYKPNYSCAVLLGKPRYLALWRVIDHIGTFSLGSDNATMKYWHSKWVVESEIALQEAYWKDLKRRIHNAALNTITVQDLHIWAQKSDFHHDSFLNPTSFGDHSLYIKVVREQACWLKS